MPLKKALHYLQPVEIITILYLLVTGFFILFTYSKIEYAYIHLFSRIGYISAIIFIVFLSQKLTVSGIKFLQSFFILALLGFFYAETDALNNVFFPYLDPFFARIEYDIFNGQPSILFYNFMPYKGFNELMNFAYFCYYPLIFFLCLWLYLKNFAEFEKVIFIICTSFFIYYIIFIILPVAGPQYYFSPPDNHIPVAFLFSKIMHTINSMAERPTAAFPSSHVGIICIVWYLSFRYAKNLLKYYIPIGILLFLSTVYIKAHYLVDVFGGILSAFPIYWISKRLYNYFLRLKSNYPK